MFQERLFQLLFWLALVFAFTMASLPQPPVLPGNPGDKLPHAFAFAVLASLAALARPRRSVWVIFIGLALFGAAIEAVKAIPELGRQPSWLDWLGDLEAAGVVLMAVAAFRFLRRSAS